MNVIETAIKEVLIFEPKKFEDDRGWFMESFNKKKFLGALKSRGLDVPEFVQDNHSMSHKGVVRGLHYQTAPYAQGKLVRVVQGRAWDVAVDIRRESPTLGKWVGIELSDVNHRQLWIPSGFAHGFIALEDKTQFLYKTTNYYSKECERSIRWNDSELDITWPKIQHGLIRQTKKDNEAPTFNEYLMIPDIHSGLE